jgi:hypothetical protein
MSVSRPSSSQSADLTQKDTLTQSEIVSAIKSNEAAVRLAARMGNAVAFDRLICGMWLAFPPEDIQKGG